MFDYFEKRKLRKVVYSPVIIFFILLLGALMVPVVWERYQVEREMAERRDQIEHEYEVLQDRSAALEERVADIQSDRGFEEVVRSRFDVVKEGEQVIVLTGDAPLVEEFEREVVASSTDEGWSWWPF